MGCGGVDISVKKHTHTHAMLVPIFSISPYKTLDNLSCYLWAFIGDHPCGSHYSGGGCKARRWGVWEVEQV